MIQPRNLLLIALLGLAAISCRDDDDVYCGPPPQDRLAPIAIWLSAAAWPSGEYRIHAEATGLSCDYAFRIPDWQPDAEDGETEDGGAINPYPGIEPEATCTPSGGDPQPVASEAFMPGREVYLSFDRRPETLQLSVTRDGETLLDASLEPDYRRYGQACADTVRAELRIELPTR